MTFGLGAQFVHEPYINFAFMLRSSALTQQIFSLFIWVLKLLNLDHLYFQMFLIQNGQPLYTCGSYHLLLGARWDGTVLGPGISTKASGDLFDKHQWWQGVINSGTKQRPGMLPNTCQNREWFTTTSYLALHARKSGIKSPPSNRLPPLISKAVTSLV